jgi:hypothetical protein
MSKRKYRRRKEKPDVPKIEALKAAAHQAGVPMFMPTDERAERGDLVLERVVGYAVQGDRPGRQPPRRVTMGYAIRDRSSEARTRLKRFGRFSSEQIDAGVHLEKDWETARLEPRMSANLMRAGAGIAGSVTDAAIDARNHVHAAVSALRLGGEEVVRVVEAVVLQGVTTTEAGSARYADKGRGIAHVTALLEVGLNLLATHYRLRQMLDRTSKSDA